MPGKVKDMLDRRGYFILEVQMTLLDRKEFIPALTNTGIFNIWQKVK